jgi:tetratricopeptide (TPR) repeat protein
MNIPLSGGGNYESVTSFCRSQRTFLKVLIVGSRFYSGNARLGYDYHWWNIIDALKRFPKVKTQFWDYITEHQRWGLAGMSERLEAVVRKEEPDLLWYLPSGQWSQVFPEILQTISASRRTQTLLWTGDDLQTLSDCGERPFVNYIATTAKLEEETDYGWGAKVIRSQWAFNPYTYSSLPLPIIREISFCGAKTKYRAGWLEEIKKIGLPVDVFGLGWQEDSFLPFSDLVRLVGSSQINLHLGRDEVQISPAVTRRHFEVTGCGGFLVTAASQDLETFFEPGKEVVVAESPEEFIEKCRFYLGHEKARRDIARQGFKRTLAEHTWSSRLGAIFREIGSDAETPFALKRTLGPTLDGLGANPAAKEMKEDADFSVTVAVMAYNELHYTRQCVESILHYTTGPYELLLADNGSTDGTYEYFQSVKRYHPNTRIIKYFGNRVVEENGNYLFSMASGKYFAGVTNDTMVHEGWLENLLAQIESDPDIGIVGPRSNNISGPQLLPAEYHSTETYQEFAVDWAARHRGESFFLDRIVGAVVLLKKSVVLRIGGYDPDLPTNGRDGGYGFSDDDFSLRLRLSGYKSLVANDVFIHHYGSRTAGKYRPDLFGPAQNINKEKYLRKLRMNDRINIDQEGEILLKPYGRDESIPLAENTVIRSPRVDFVEVQNCPLEEPCQKMDLAEVAKSYGGKTILHGGRSFPALLAAVLAEKQCDYIVLIDQRLAPALENIQALAENALNHPDVAIMVPVGNYAPSTHRPQGHKGVEIIPYADLSLCVFNLRIIRFLSQGLSRITNQEELVWFLQRRVRGEGYFIAKVNDVLINAAAPLSCHPYDEKILPERLILEEKYDEARGIYREDIVLDPTFAESHYQLACLAKARHQTIAAIEHAEQALKADAHHILSLVLLSRIFLERKDLKRAAGVVQQAHMKQPGHPEVQKIVNLYESQMKGRTKYYPKKGKKKKKISHRPSATGGATLSLCMIVKDEVGNLADCLGPLRTLVDEIIVVDTGSTDGTGALAQELGGKVFDITWKDDFSAARNESIRRATGQYILWLDADDRMDLEEIEKLKRIKGKLRQREPKGYYFVIQSLSPHEGENFFWHQLRLFPNKPGVQFEGRIHEQALLSLNRLGIPLEKLDIKIRHTGYESESTTIKKHQRNWLILKSELEKNPDNLLGCFHAARTLAGMDRLPEAIEFLNKITDNPLVRKKEKDLYLQTAMLLGRFNLKRNKFLEAQDLFKQLAVDYPDNPMVHFGLGESYCLSGDYERACRPLCRSLELPLEISHTPIKMEKTVYDQFTTLAICYQKMGNVEKALEVLKEYVARYPGHAQGWKRLGVMALENNRFSEAVDHFQEAISKGGSSDQLLANLGLCYRKLGKWSEAEQALREALAINPDRLEALTGLGHLFYRRKELDSALDFFSRALALEEQPIDILLFVSDILVQKGDVDGLVSACDELLNNLNLEQDLTIENLQELAGLYYKIAGALDQQGKPYLSMIALQVGFTLVPDQEIMEKIFDKSKKYGMLDETLRRLEQDLAPLKNAIPPTFEPSSSQLPLR